MSGGLINIVSYGAQDLYLTGDPQITFFKIAYRRHTNFSTESVEIDINDELIFNERSEIRIKPFGDAIHKAYLEITVPRIAIKKTDVGLTPVQASQEELDAKLYNYNIVTEFMKINTNAYRASYENIYVENVTTSTVIEHALDQFQDTYVESESVTGIKSTTVDNYNILMRETTFDNPVITSSTTNLYLILDEIRDDIANGINMEKSELKLILDRTMKKCIDVQKHFHDEIIQHKKDVSSDSSPYVKFAWVKKLAHAMIDCIEVSIGGETIDRHTGIWIDIWHELTGKRDQSDMYAEMIGDVSKLSSFDRSPKPEYKMFLPLNFWFNRFNGLSFPLVALQYSDFSININMNKLSRCCYMERLTNTSGQELFVSLDDIWDDSGYKLKGKIYMDYVFMESKERKKFAQSAHEYLIDTVQDATFKRIDKPKERVPLDFSHPCKELVWVAQKNALITNDTSFNRTFTRSYGIESPESAKVAGLDPQDLGNPFKYSQLDLSNHVRVEKNEGNYFNYYQTMKHRNTPADGINVYTFALNPEEHQPSGTCNMTVIPHVIMRFNLDPAMFKYKLSEVRPDIVPGSEEDIELDTTVTIYVFAVAYNVIRVVSGFAGRAYS
mgnify:CR=1 FL=1